MKILVFHFSNMRTKDKDFRRPEIMYVVSTADSLLSDFLYFSGTLPDCVRGRSGVVPCQQGLRQRDCAKIGPAKITPAETTPAGLRQQRSGQRRSRQQRLRRRRSRQRRSQQLRQRDHASKVLRLTRQNSSLK